MVVLLLLMNPLQPFLLTPSCLLSWAEHVGNGEIHLVIPALLE